MNRKFIPIKLIKNKVLTFQIEENDVVVLNTIFGDEIFYILNIIYNDNGKLENTIICRYYQNNYSTRGRRNCIGPSDLGNLDDIGVLLGILYIRDNNAIIRLRNRNNIYNLIKYYKTYNNFIIKIRKLPNELFNKIFDFI